MERRKEEGTFCQAYLRTMDPERSAGEAGRKDGYALLGTRTVQARLEKMRAAAVGQIQREDIIRRLAQLAFGRANDAVRLALHAGEADPETLDLSAVTEFKVTDKSVEVKLADRIRALETLWGLLESPGNDQELYRALAEAAGDTGEGWGDE